MQPLWPGGRLRITLKDVAPVVCVIWVSALIAYFVRGAATNLENFRQVSADEVTILSVSYKLATQGIFGSDLYPDLYNADQHYFMNLPAYHVWQALAFRVFGAGVAQARWASLASGVALIVVVSWLSYRWHGAVAAVVTSALLVLWPSDLISSPATVPLLDVSRSGRYDANAVLWVWLCVACLDGLLRRPGRLRALAVGVCAGLATLTQFFGVAAVLIVAVVYARSRGERALTGQLVLWSASGMALVVMPYAVAVAQHPGDALDQQMTLGDRAQFDRFEFYAQNVMREPLRFQAPVRRAWALVSGARGTFSPLLLVAGIGPAAVGVWRRMRREHGQGDRLLWLSVLIGVAGLALLEQTKAPLYAIVLLPAVCLMLGALGRDVWRWAWRPDRPPPVRYVTVALTIACLGLVGLEGIQAYRRERSLAAQVSPYAAVGRRIASYLPAGAHVLGSERWWWALRGYPYLAASDLFWTWESRAAEGRAVSFAQQLADAQVDTIIVNNNIRGAMVPYPMELRVQFWQFLATCTQLIANWTDASYARIEIYRLNGNATCSS